MLLTPCQEILATSLALVALTILVSAVLLYATCVAHESCRDENGIVDLPSAAYVVRVFAPLPAAHASRQCKLA